MCVYSVSSLKKGSGQSVNHRLRRRSSSLTDVTEPSTKSLPATTAQIAALDRIRNGEKEDERRTSSSPDLNVVDLPSQEDKLATLKGSSEGREGTREGEREQDRSDVTGEEEEEGKKGVLLEGVSDSLNADRMSVSTTGSAVSGISGDDAETVVDENEKSTPRGERKSRGALSSSDLDFEGDQEYDSSQVEGLLDREQLSASSSTLQNEKQDGDREDSVEPQRRHLMSVSFRQELLSVCQLKTDPKLDGEVTKLASPSMDVVQLLGRTLPHIVPHMIHNKREVRKKQLQMCIYMYTYILAYNVHVLLEWQDSQLVQG